MSTRDFTATITVDQPPAEVFAAVTNVRGWWSADIEGDTGQPGDKFRFDIPGVHRCTMTLTEVVPGERIVWSVSDSHIDYVEDKTEWDGTEVVVDIAARDGRTELRFTHLGLVPDVECFDACSDAWGAYVTGSLRSLITTGTGAPHRNGPAAGTGLARHHTGISLS